MPFRALCRLATGSHITRAGEALCILRARISALPASLSALRRPPHHDCFYRNTAVRQFTGHVWATRQVVSLSLCFRQSCPQLTDTSTAYSLSGDVVISLSSSYSLFERRRAIRLLLESLIIEFEGQCELITDETGYTPFRVCSVSKELVVREAVELSNEGHEDASLPSVWSVAFSLVIPGWLPPTSAYGDCESGDAGTRYGLYASAKFLDLDEGSSRSLFSLCTAPFRPRTRVIAAPRCEVTVNRFISTLVDDPSSPSTSSTIDYTVLPEQRKDQSSSGFPYEVISKLRAAVSVPEHIDVDDDSFSLCIRLRTQDLPESECKRLRITGFEVDVEQTEHYRYVSSSLAIIRLPHLCFAASRSRLPTNPRTHCPRPPTNPHASRCVTPTPLRSYTKWAWRASARRTLHAPAPSPSSPQELLAAMCSQGMDTPSEMTQTLVATSHGTVCGRRCPSPNRSMRRKAKQRADCVLQGRVHYLA